MSTSESTVWFDWTGMLTAFLVIGRIQLSRQMRQMR